jgi:hypothetical protein
MKSSRFAATGLLVVALLSVAGCGSGTSTTDSRIINFDKNHDGGVILRKAADVSKLKGTPEDFRQFMAGVIDTNVHAGPIDKQCPVTVSVVKFDPSGYASGGIGDCGGAVLMWGKQHGVWQQVWGGQDIPACVDLKKYAIPSSIAGTKCWAGKGAVRYTG